MTAILLDTASEALKAASNKHGKVEIDFPLLGAFKFGLNDNDKLREAVSWDMKTEFLAEHGGQPARHAPLTAT